MWLCVRVCGVLVACVWLHVCVVVCVSAFPEGRVQISLNFQSKILKVRTNALSPLSHFTEEETEAERHEVSHSLYKQDEVGYLALRL